MKVSSWQPRKITEHFLRAWQMQKNPKYDSFPIDPHGRFGPMPQAFLTTTNHPPPKPWCTLPHNSKRHCPNANLMYSRASTPPYRKNTTSSLAVTNRIQSCQIRLRANECAHRLVFFAPIFFSYPLVLDAYVKTILRV